jgi:hypothetical protein
MTILGLAGDYIFLFAVKRGSYFTGMFPELSCEYENGGQIPELLFIFVSSG